MNYLKDVRLIYSENMINKSIHDLDCENKE